jgi:polynucleotide 5'-kinase involved in rRNA processing
MNFKPLRDMKVNKAKIKNKVHLVTEETLNKYLKNRRLIKFRIRDNKILISLADGRTIVAEHIDEDEWTLKLKNKKQCMTEREIEEFNYQVEKALANTRKSVPRECRACVADLDNLE